MPHSWNATDRPRTCPPSAGTARSSRSPGRRATCAASGRCASRARTTAPRSGSTGRRSGASPACSRSRRTSTGLRRGRNTLVVKVSTLRSRTDLTHWRPAAFNGYGTGGWWNYGGLLREVYVRPIDTVDMEDVQVVPRAGRARGPARVEVRALVRNLTRTERDVTMVLNARRPAHQAAPADGRRRSDPRSRDHASRSRDRGCGSPAARRSIASASPRHRRPPARPPTGSASGSRSSRRGGGVMFLNGRRLNLRGASIHEDDLEGAARSARAPAALLHPRACARWAARSPAPTTRSTPRSSRRSTGSGSSTGLQAPVYQLPNCYFDQAAVRRCGHARRGAHGAQQPQPPVGLHLVGGQRAGGQPRRARRDRPRARPLHPRRRRGRAGARRHALRGHRPPVPARRGADEPRLPRPRRARGERVLRLVSVDHRDAAASPPRRWRSSGPTSTSSTAGTRASRS